MDEIKKLKDRKKALKLTTAHLAYLADLPVGTVSKVMTGETKNPSYITIDKIDRALLHEEMLLRIKKYRELLMDYIKNHQDENVDQKEFEKKYREDNNLNDAPIPYAIPILHENDGNLALRKDDRVDVSILNEIGEDKLIELLDGHLIFNEAPGIIHQRIVQNLGKVLDKYISSNKGKCQMFNVGVDVRLDEDEYTSLIPDVLIVCDGEKVHDDAIYGAPDFVIEVTSPSTRHRDYNEKMHKYMVSGVREYWIVDIEKEKVTTYIEGEPMMAYIYSFDDEIPIYIYNGQVKIKLNAML